ncbi:membrane-associated protein, putative, partial [Bodo saltans]
MVSLSSRDVPLTQITALRLLLRLLLLSVCLLSKTTTVALSFEIPCTAIPNNAFMVTSNSTYTLTNCDADTLFLDLVPLYTGSDRVLENVTIRVVGGTVLARLSATTFTVVRNIHVSVTGVNVNRTVSVSSTLAFLPITVLDISGSPENVDDVSVSFENTTLSLQVSSAVPIRVAPLLHLIGNALASRFTDISISCRNSNLSVLVNLSIGATFFGTSVFAMVVTMIAMEHGLVYNVSIERITIAVVSSSVSSIISGDFSSGLYYRSYVALFLVRCTQFRGGSIALLKNFVFSSNNNVSYTLIGRMPRNSSDTFSVVSTSSFSVIDTLHMSFEGLTLLSLEGVCGGANCSVATQSWPTVRIVEVRGEASVTAILNVSIIVSRAKISTRTPRKAVLFKCSDALTLRNISVTINDNIGRFLSSSLDVAGASREFFLTEVSAIDNVTQLSIVVKRCSLTFEQVIDGGVSVLASVAHLADNISFATVDVSDVNVTSIIANGTAFLNGAIAALSMGTSIVNVIMETPSILNIGTNVHISISNCTLIAAHLAAIPLNAFVAVIASNVAAVNVVRSLSNSTIVVNNVHVTRSFLEAQANVPGSNVQTTRSNVTAAVALFDVLTAMLVESGSLSPFLPFLFSVSGGLPATVFHTNVTTTVTNGSSVLTTSSNLGDFFGLIAFPSVSNRCTYIVSDIASSTRSGVVGSVGHTTVINSIVNVNRVSGVSSLIVAVLGSLVFLGPNNQVTFDQVLVEATDLIRIASVRFALVAVSTFIEDERTMEPSLPPLFSMTRCQFRGFDAILNPSSFILNNGAPLLLLGCNLWDDAPLPPSKITSNLTLRRFISYPESSFNESVTCSGYTKSLTETQSPPAARDNFHTSLESLITAGTSSGVAIYASLVTQFGVVGGAIPSLQRAMTSVRLASLCTLVSDSSVINSGSGENVMSSDTSENPLRLSLPVGKDSLSYAAGASVGNAVLASAVGVAIHYLAKKQQTQQHHHKRARLGDAITSMLPSSLLPGSIVIPYIILGQPAISACVALLMSVDRTAQSVACGTLMLVCAWLAYPIGCVYLVLWRGRQGSVSRAFALQATRTVQRRTARDAKILSPGMQSCLMFLMTPLQKWRLHPGCSKRGTPERRYAEFD